MVAAAFAAKYENADSDSQAGVRPLAELISDAGDLARTEARDFEVLVALAAPLDTRLGRPATWLDAPAVSRWLDSRAIDNRDVRQSGGLVVSVSALDPIAASRKAIEVVDRFTSRAGSPSRSQSVEFTAGST